MRNERNGEQEREAYRKTLSEGRDYLSILGLENDPPTERVTIIPGTEGEGKPLGANLPVYPNDECTTDENGIRKTLWNLYILTGFIPFQKGS